MGICVKQAWLRRSDAGCAPDPGNQPREDAPRGAPDGSEGGRTAPFRDAAVMRAGCSVARAPLHINDGA
jgi:hypothetical protein